MKALLACASAFAVVMLVDPGRLLYSLAVVWIGLAVALAPLVGEHLHRRRKAMRRPTGRYSGVRSLPYGQSLR